jgi:hypothetical protein
MEETVKGASVKGYKHKEDLGVLPYHQQEIEWPGAILRTIVYLKTVE